jgi:hypothetical protein
LSRRLALLQWAKKAGAIVIEDDYDGEFRYEGRPVESMQGLDTEGRVIYVGTFSRTIFPALRIGYLIAPKSVAPALITGKWLCDRHTATLEQETLAEFIATGAYERHLRRARRANALRRQALLEAADEYLGDRVSLTGDGSGAHVVLWLRGRVSEEAINVVPDSYKFGSLALGASKLQTIAKVVLPTAIPGIITGVILGMGRAVGETAAVLLTAGSVAKVPDSVFDPVRTMTVHIYTLATENLSMKNAYGTAAALVIMILAITLISNYITQRYIAKLGGKR